MKKIQALTMLLVVTVVLVSLAVTSRVAAAPSHGALTIAFDDGMQNEFDYAWPAMQARGIVGTFYVATSHISDYSGDNSFMSLAELHTLQDAGNEIGSHSADHPHFETLTDAQIEYECGYSQQVLQSNGFSAVNFAFPYGDTNDPNAVHIDSIVSKYYRSGRSAYGDVRYYSFPIDLFRLPGFDGETGDNTVLSQVESIVNQAYDQNGWTIIYFHNVIPNVYNNPFTISSKDFATFLDYVVAKGMPTYTVNQALNGGLPASISPNSVRMDVGGSKTFVSYVLGGVSPYSYQWYLNNGAVGINSSRYTFNPSSTGLFSLYVNVTDSAGVPVTFKSNIASITVNSALVAPAVKATHGTVDQGQSSVLSISSAVTTGTSPYTYQWYSKAPGGGSYSSISDATSASYDFITSGSTATGAWSFKLQVTDATGATVNSNVISVTVNIAPTVNVSPASWTMDAGQTKRFSATPSGGSGIYLSYQWYVDGEVQTGEIASKFSFALVSSGSYLITVTVTDSLGATSAESSATTVTVNSASATNLVVSGFPSPTAAGEAHTVTVTAYDAYGNVATGYAGTVAITSSDAQAVLPASAGLTDGVGYFSVTLETVGSQSITATDTVTSSITGSQTIITVNPGPATYLAVSSWTSQVAGAAFSVTVTAKDACGNTATGYAGTVHFSSSDSGSGVTLPGNYVFQVGDNGVKNFSVTLVKAGTESITATDTVASSITGSQSDIAVTHATAVANVVISPAGSSVTAGLSKTFSATASDAYGNTWDVSPSTSWSISSGAGGSWNSNVYTSATAGSWTVTGTYASTVYTTGLSVNPADLDHFVFNPVATQTTGSAFFITVTAVDVYSNTATSYTGMPSLSYSAGTISPGTMNAFIGGIGSTSVTVTTADSSVTIMATDGTHTVTSNSFTVNPTISTSAGANGAISPTGSVSVDYGGNQSFTITANTGYYIVDVSVNGSSVGAVSSYTFSNVQAEYTISATFAPTPTPTPTATPTSSPTSTPIPAVTPTPTTVLTPTQAPTTSPKQTQSSLPREAIYGMTPAIAIVAIGGTVLILRKKQERQKLKETPAT